MPVGDRIGGENTAEAPTKVDSHTWLFETTAQYSSIISLWELKIINARAHVTHTVSYSQKISNNPDLTKSQPGE